MYWRASAGLEIRLPRAGLRVRAASRFRALAVLCCVGLSAVAAFSTDLIVFGPQTYTRAPGKPVEVKKTFRVSRPSGPYLVRVTNHGVTSALITLNGKTILAPKDFTLQRGRPWPDDEWDRHTRGRDDDHHGGGGDADRRDGGSDRRGGDADRRGGDARDRDGKDRDGRGRDDRDEHDDESPVAFLARPVTLRNGTNEIVVELRGLPGTSLTVEIVGSTSQDNVPPVITTSVAPPPNANGWNNANVTVTFMCSDAGSGIATCPPAVTVSTEGANQVVSGTAVDKAGNRASASVTLNIDQTNPTITVSLMPAPNANGVSTGPVTAHFTCADSGSGLATCPVDQVVSSPGANQTVTGTATDRAGNAASVTSAPFTSQIGTPTLTILLSPPPTGSGWHDTPVTAHFTCTESGLPLAGCPADRVVATEGANQTVTGSVTDAAGQTALVTSDPFSIDLSLPTITVALTPGPNANGWRTGPVTAHFTCADTLSGVVGCPPDQVVSAEGTALTVTGTVADLAGNSASVVSAPFNIDRTPPTIDVALSSSLPPTNGWYRAPVAVHFTCSDGGSGVATCPPDQQLSAEGAGQPVNGTAIDAAGNSASAAASVSIDRTPPTVTLSPPTTGTTVFTPSVNVSGLVADAGAGVDTATCNGAPALVSAGAITCVVSLTPGSNRVNASVTDRAGNAASASLDYSYTRAPIITIHAPANLTYTSISPTTVTGTVDEPGATVRVNAIQAAVVNGSFSVALPLAEGPNIITATASTPAGASGTASLTVTLDTTPPHVTVTSPPDQFVTTDTAISVSGIVNDIVVGTVNPEQAGVTVNGAAAQVANRTFLASNVPLALGSNIINVVGRDRVGNQATTRVTVMRTAPTAQPRIQLVSGNGQSGVIRSRLPVPLAVALTDGLGNPVPNKPVIFKVTQNDGLVAAGGVPAPTVIATTDAQGHAEAQWTLGGRAGAGGNGVEAYAVGFEGTALFTATGAQGAAGTIVVDTGNNQIGPIGQRLPRPFIAVVIDEGNNRLAGVPVTFTVLEGGGDLDGQPSVTMTSDPDGRVAVTLTLGTQEGNNNNFVSATFAGNQGFPAAFTASGRFAGDPSETTITGVVLDNSNLPIPGVTVRAVQTEVLHANGNAANAVTPVQTDAQGQFTIPQAPVGFVKLLVDGSTATAPGSYPTLDYDLVTVAGQDNTVGQPIYLLPLNSANSLCVTDTTGGGTLTIPEAPGFSLTFGPGQVTFPGGSKSGCVSVTVVHPDKVPMAPGFGQQPRFIVTIQPAGALFNPPAPITLPNVDGLAPRAVTEMYSFDHDISTFVAIGTGTVSDDGLVIRSSAGVGVLKAGWHCGGDSKLLGTTSHCAACNRCVPTAEHPEGACAPDDSLTCGSGLTCEGGACVECAQKPIAPYTPTDPYPLNLNVPPMKAETVEALSCMKDEAALAGGSFTVVSGFRPQDYQNHLREVWVRYQQLDREPLMRDYLQTPKCANVLFNIAAEWFLHKLAFEPGIISNHTAGTAFDASWTLPQWYYDAGLTIDDMAAFCKLSRCVTVNGKLDEGHFCR